MTGEHLPKNIWALTAMDGPLVEQVKRLEEVLPTDEKQASRLRHEIALAMLQDVVEALKGSEHIKSDNRKTNVLIISPDRRIDEVARDNDIHFKRLENKRGGLNAAIAEGIHWLAENTNADALLFIAPDLPLATPTAIDRLIESDDGSSESAIILGPSRGGGTTVIYMRPIELDFNPQYTNPSAGSQTFARHFVEARRALKGRSPLIFDSFVLSSDIDVEEDLIELEIHGRDTRTWETVGPLLAYRGRNNRDYSFGRITEKVANNS